MKRTNIYLTGHQVKALGKLARQIGITTSELIRRILDEWLKRREGSKT